MSVMDIKWRWLSVRNLRGLYHLSVLATQYAPYFGAVCVA